PFDQLTLVLLAALRQLGHPLHLMLLDDDDAVGVADHRVSWAHELPADDQRLVDRAERLLDRPRDADARGEDGEPECPQMDGVADTAVGDDCSDALRLRRVSEDVTERPCLAHLPRRDDQHVTGARVMDRHLEHQIVTGAQTTVRADPAKCIEGSIGLMRESSAPRRPWASWMVADPWAPSACNACADGLQTFVVMCGTSVAAGAVVLGFILLSCRRSVRREPGTWA